MKVTCIMPCSRNEDLPTAIDVFLSQDYDDKELLIGLDSIDGVDLSYLQDSNVFTFYQGGKETIGTKRNRLCQAAKGEVIVHFDSDDWYAPDYITRSVDFLVSSGAKITGLSEAYFYRPGDNRMWLFKKRFTHGYVIGSGMCYYRSEWEQRKFVNKNSGEDLEFQTQPGTIKDHGYIDGFMAMIHKNNTASHLQLAAMTPVNPEIAESILGESYSLYK